MDDSAPSARRIAAVAALAGDGGPHLVTATGELDLATVPELRRALSDAMNAGGNDVVVDLTQAEFIDSSTISLLMNACRRLTRSGRGFAVAAPPGPITRILQITALTETLGVCATVPDAIERAARGPAGPATVG